LLLFFFRCSIYRFIHLHHGFFARNAFANALVVFLAAIFAEAVSTLLGIRSPSRRDLAKGTIGRGGLGRRGLAEGSVGRRGLAEGRVGRRGLA
jgi:hypothetical protein